MRVIPGMVVINPSDDIEAKAAVKAAYEYVGPVYLRFGRLAAPVINDRPDYKFEIGKGVTLREGKDLTVVATGLMGLRLPERKGSDQSPEDRRQRRLRRIRPGQGSPPQIWSGCRRHLYEDQGICIKKNII